jgi:kynureninase
MDYHLLNRSIAVTDQDQFIFDMGNHMGARLRQLIGDVANTCLDGDMKSDDVVRMLIATLMYEVVRSASIMKMDENNFAEVCRRMHRELRPTFAKQMRELKASL